MVILRSKVHNPRSRDLLILGDQVGETCLAEDGTEQILHYTILHVTYMKQVNKGMLQMNLAKLAH